MLGLLERIKTRRYRAAQRDRALRQLEHVTSQLQACAAPGSVSREGYVHGYILGILDAVTATYETETRHEVGLELHRSFFVDFVSACFACRRSEARRIFDATRSLSLGRPRETGIVDGRSDGVAALRFGRKPDLLLRHLAQGHAPAGFAH